MHPDDPTAQQRDLSDYQLFRPLRHNTPAARDLITTETNQRRGVRQVV